jgi:hypothetical protein
MHWKECFHIPTISKSDYNWSRLTVSLCAESVCALYTNYYRLFFRNFKTIFCCLVLSLSRGLCLSLHSKEDFVITSASSFRIYATILECFQIVEAFSCWFDWKDFSTWCCFNIGSTLDIFHDDKSLNTMFEEGFICDVVSTCWNNVDYSIQSAIFPSFAYVTTGPKPCVHIVTRSCYSPVLPMRNTYRAQ